MYRRKTEILSNYQVVSLKNKTKTRENITTLHDGYLYLILKWPR
jgi:hypothetical protein